MKELTWSVYILSCSDGTLYTGITNDLKKRIEAHNLGKTGAKYTKPRRPVTLFYQETVASKGEALKRELAIKAMDRKKKLILPLLRLDK